MNVLKADPREHSRSHRIRLGEGKLQPEHKHNLHRSGSLPASPRRAVNSPAIVTSLPEPGVAKLPLRRSQQGAGMHTSPLPNTLIEKPCRGRSLDQLVARHLHSVPPWVLSFAQPRTMRTISAAASAVPSPNLVGSTLLRSLSMCCSMTQLSVNFIKTSTSAVGRSLRGQGCVK